VDNFTVAAAWCRWFTLTQQLAKDLFLSSVKKF
jgi:hypothetical protein